MTSTFLPIAASLFVGLVIFFKAWEFAPISGLIALIGYLFLGVILPLWFLAPPVSASVIVFTIVVLVVTGIFTLRVLRQI